MWGRPVWGIQPSVVVARGVLVMLTRQLFDLPRPAGRSRDAVGTLQVPASQVIGRFDWWSVSRYSLHYLPDSVNTCSILSVCSI